MRSSRPRPRRRRRYYDRNTAIFAEERCHNALERAPSCERVRALLLAIALLLTGCVSVPGAEPGDAAGSVASALPFPDPMGADHDHSDVTLHGYAYGFEQTAHHPLAATALRGAGVHALDAKGGYLFAALYVGDADADGGFFAFDIADPLNPVEVGRYRFPGQLAGDRSLEATEEGDWVVLGTEAIDCAGHVNPFAPGLYLIDARDKGAMKPVAHVPAIMVHSVTIHRIGDDDYVFTLMSTTENIYRIVKGPVPQLEPVGSVTIGHDSVIMDDPVMGVPLLYASNGDGGFVVHDVSDPTQPQQVAEWNIPDREEGQYYIHTGVVQMIGDRRIAIVTSEDWLDYPSALWVLDATDFGLIETIATWTTPNDHAAEGLRYSMHNPRFLGDDLILSYYHGGAWSLDLSDPANPRAQGVFMPGESSGYRPEKPKTSAYADQNCGEFTFADAPYVMDVETVDGAVYVADLHTGLYTLRPTT